MTSGSPKYPAKHCHVYEYSTIEATPQKLNYAPLYPKAHVKHNHHHEEPVMEAPRRVRVIEYEFAPRHVKADDHHVSEENVDKEAEEFIKGEHKRFELSKLISMAAG